MEKVNQVIQRTQQQKNSSQTTTGNQTVINRLFATIKIAYPNAFRDMDEGTTKRMWMAHMIEFEAEKIEAAAKDMVNRYPTWPPTLGEFKKLIREQNVARPELMEFKALPAPSAKQEIADEYLTKMREVLR
ncbi:MAG: hypothetical protein HOB01_08305 [Gammaproteobacteria bacterium]|nr:hypothetical protein [Gammaproteobacteria bacterium]